MAIECISALEVVMADEDRITERWLHEHARQLGELPGCLACNVTRSTGNPGSWVLSSCWMSPACMHEYFCTPFLIDFLANVSSRASRMTFKYFPEAV